MDARTPSSCPGPSDDWLVCADFESSLEPLGTTQSGSDVVVRVVSDEVARGTGAARMVTDGDQSQLALVGGGLDQLDDTGDLYLRFHARVGRTTTSSFTLLTLLSTDPSAEAPRRINLGSTGRLSFEIEGDAVPLGIELPRDAWRCIELHVELDASDGRVELWVGPERAELTGLPTRPSVGLDLFILGVAAFASGPVDLAIDEVVLSRSRIGCY